MMVLIAVLRVLIAANVTIALIVHRVHVIVAITSFVNA